MPPEHSNSFPFVTRKMLSFEQNAVFSLKISCQSSVQNEITIRGFTREGAFTLKHQTAGGGQESSDTFRIPDIPVMLSVVDENNFFRQGQCHIVLSLVINDDTLYHLCSGLVYANMGVTYPNTSRGDSRPGGGNLTDITGTNPAAGSEISETVTSGEVWRLISMTFTLVTSATVANRRVHFQVNGGEGRLLDAFSDIDQPASTTRQYTVAAFGNLPDREDGDDILIPIPPDFLVSNTDTLETSTTNLQSGDNFSAPILYYESFFTIPT